MPLNPLVLGNLLGGLFGGAVGSPEYSNAMQMRPELVLDQSALGNVSPAIDPRQLGNAIPWGVSAVAPPSAAEQERQRKGDKEYAAALEFFRKYEAEQVAKKTGRKPVARAPAYDPANPPKRVYDL